MCIISVMSYEKKGRLFTLCPSISRIAKGLLQNKKTQYYKWNKCIASIASSVCGIYVWQPNKQSSNGRATM